MQRFKSVYFPDHPGADVRKRHLRLAFGQRDERVFAQTNRLSSTEVRERIGLSWADLVKAAEGSGVSLNRYCIDKLATAPGTVADGDQLALPGILVPAREQVTYTGGRGEPMHAWYPYLEAYSPSFVDLIIDTYSPQAQSVLDPFSGCGTTPLTTAKRGLQAWYCELNPLLQFLTETKAEVAACKARRRRELAAELLRTAKDLPSQVARCKPDPDLLATYTATFGPSRFFDDGTFDEVLRARTFADELGANDRLLGNLLVIAMLRSLVPASLLQRAGDLRFKTKVELTRKAAFIPAVQDGLQRIEQDLGRVVDIASRPVLLCADARGLGQVADIEVDLIVTSPPYLNGTNYFRNTKVELWFLRGLKTAGDLSGLRLRAVTAGICDVSKGKSTNGVPAGVSRVAASVSEHAYDARIPRMIESYFADLMAVFQAARHHLRRTSRVVIDIGDSIYAGVHVPTDELLVECLGHLGYEIEHRQPLRKRRSRGGLALRQTLLVFNAGRRTLPRTGIATRLSPDWASFKATLPHQLPPYASRNWGHPLHSLCSFQGKLKPAVARFLIEAFVPKQGSVLDPFAGVGTIPFEAALQGRRAFGFEISPAAWIIAKAKVGRPNAEACSRVIDDLEASIGSEKPADGDVASAAAISFNGPLQEYFHPRTLREVLLARRFMKMHPVEDASHALVYACVLHILHGNRPYACSRRSHPITPFAPTGEFEYRALIPRLRDKARRSLDAVLPPEFAAGDIFEQDSTEVWPQAIKNLDAVITSPPFYDSTRFYLANWMRLWMAGWSREDFTTRPQRFVDELQKKSLDVYRPVFRQARERLKAGGLMVLHLGKSWKCDMAAELGRIAHPWFRVLDQFDESVAHCESHGIRDKGTVSQHQYLVLG